MELKENDFQACNNVQSEVFPTHWGGKYCTDKAATVDVMHAPIIRRLRLPLQNITARQQQQQQNASGVNEKSCHYKYRQSLQDFSSQSRKYEKILEHLGRQAEHIAAESQPSTHRGRLSVSAQNSNNGAILQRQAAQNSSDVLNSLEFTHESCQRFTENEQASTEGEDWHAEKELLGMMMTNTTIQQAGAGGERRNVKFQTQVNANLFRLAAERGEDISQKRHQHQEDEQGGEEEEEEEAPVTYDEVIFKQYPQIYEEAKLIVMSGQDFRKFARKHETLEDLLVEQQQRIKQLEREAESAKVATLHSCRTDLNCETNAINQQLGVGASQTAASFDDRSTDDNDEHTSAARAYLSTQESLAQNFAGTQVTTLHTQRDSQQQQKTKLISDLKFKKPPLARQNSRKIFSTTQTTTSDQRNSSFYSQESQPQEKQITHSFVRQRERVHSLHPPASHNEFQPIAKQQQTFANVLPHKEYSPGLHKLKNAGGALSQRHQRSYGSLHSGVESSTFNSTGNLHRNNSAREFVRDFDSKQKLVAPLPQAHSQVPPLQEQCNVF